MRNLKKNEQKSFKDPEYQKMMMKLFVMENMSKQHDDEIGKREEQFRLQTQALKDELEAQHSAELEALAKEKSETEREFEEKKRELEGQVATALQGYTEAVQRNIQSREVLFRSQTTKAELAEKQASLHRVDERIDAKVTSLWSDRSGR